MHRGLFVSYFLMHGKSNKGLAMFSHNLACPQGQGRKEGTNRWAPLSKRLDGNRDQLLGFLKQAIGTNRLDDVQSLASCFLAFIPTVSLSSFFCFKSLRERERAISIPDHHSPLCSTFVTITFTIINHRHHPSFHLHHPIGVGSSSTKVFKGFQNPVPSFFFSITHFTDKSTQS